MELKKIRLVNENAMKMLIVYIEDRVQRVIVNPAGVMKENTLRPNIFQGSICSKRIHIWQSFGGDQNDISALDVGVTMK